MREKRIVYIAIGSNLGDRALYLTQGRDALRSLPDTRVLAETPVEETAPVGLTDQPPFLNQMVAIETGLDLHSLLEALHAIESRAGRERGERWGPRTLDLDIVETDGEGIVSPNLTVPHPELPNRDFWQRELELLRQPARPR